MAITRRRVEGHVIVYDEATSLRLARFGHEITGPERSVRSFLFGSGLRFRTRNRDLPGSPDVANRSRRWAVFVHGCFWHQHARCRRATVPRRNRVFWLAKFAKNRKRDNRVISTLKRNGYAVAVIWECQATRLEVLRRQLGSLVVAARKSKAHSRRA